MPPGGAPAAEAPLDSGRAAVLWQGEHGVRLRRERPEGSESQGAEAGADEGQVVSQRQHEGHDHAGQGGGTGGTGQAVQLQNNVLCTVYRVYAGLVSLNRLLVSCGTMQRRQSGYLLGFCLVIRVIYTMLPPHGHWLILA